MCYLETKFKTVEMIWTLLILTENCINTVIKQVVMIKNLTLQLCGLGGKTVEGMFNVHSGSFTHS